MKTGTRNLSNSLPRLVLMSQAQRTAAGAQHWANPFPGVTPFRGAWARLPEGSPDMLLVVAA